MVILSPVPVVNLSNQKVKAVTAGALGKEIQPENTTFLHCYHL